LNASPTQTTRTTTSGTATIPIPECAPKNLSNAPRPKLVQHLVAVTLITIATIGVNGWHLNDALGWSDGPNHLFDGIFIYEFAREIPLNNARGWAEQFYLRHPTLGIVVYWPPGFAAMEALTFAIFGVSLLAARMLVLAFVAATGMTMYGLGRQLFGSNCGLYAALLLIASPAGARWAGDVMLEWPATFWMTLALVCYAQSLRSNSKRWPVLMFGVAVVMAFLTKQTAGIVLPVALLHALSCTAGRRWLFRPTTIATGAVIALVVLTYGKLAAPYTALPEKLLAWSPDLKFYVANLPEMFGWPLVGFVIVGIVGQGIQTVFKKRASEAARGDPEILRHELDVAESMRAAADSLNQQQPLVDSTVAESPDTLRDESSHDSIVPTERLSSQQQIQRPFLLLAIWLFAWWVFSSTITAKEPRYFFFALPPLLMLAVSGWQGLIASVSERPQSNGKSNRSQTRLTKAAIGAFALIFGTQAFLAVHAHPGNPPSYQPAVDALIASGNANLVLIDAVRDGQFVYDLYANEQARASLIPVRASKLLYARAARMKYAGVELVKSSDDIINLLNQYGIRYLVMESRLPDTHYTDADPRPRKLLRELVTTDDRFMQRGEWPLGCDDPAWDRVKLWLIEYTACPPRERQTIDIPVPAMGKTVTIQLTE